MGEFHQPVKGGLGVYVGPAVVNKVRVLPDAVGVDHIAGKRGMVRLAGLEPHSDR